MMKKILIYTTLFLVLIVLLLLVYVKWTSTIPKPMTTAGEQAELLTAKVYQALNKPAWDSTAWVSWTYAGRNNYLWNKAGNEVRVRSKELEVILNLNDLSATATKSRAQLSGDELEKARVWAWKNFCNDSFWLIAPYKITDEATQRSISQSGGLMVTYPSGGVTPGDTYLWSFNQDGVPTDWHMWTSILPLKGLHSTWEEWVTLPTGAKISTTHRIAGLLTVHVTDLEAGATFDGWKR
jgi:hypothetical protein